MSEMKWHKRVWLTEEDAEEREWHLDGPLALEEREYIRADLVDGLVEALEHTAQLLEALGGTALMAKDALKALEEPDV